MAPGKPNKYPSPKNQPIMYTQSITRCHRTAFLLLIDASGSMAEEIHFHGRKRTKAEAVATIADDLLFELVERARRDDGVRDYYDIGVWAYSGNDNISPIIASEGEMISVEALSRIPTLIRREVIEYRLPDGSHSLREIPTRCWCTPRAEGLTPMCEALRRARDRMAAWCAEPQNAESFPPVIFNITDGEATDSEEEDLRLVARQIRELSTADGWVLLINIHLGSDNEPGIFFPTENEVQRCRHRYARLLYELSSTMPPTFDNLIRSEKGAAFRPPFRGMSYNASATEVVTMLNIGSISVKTE